MKEPDKDGKLYEHTLESRRVAKQMMQDAALGGNKICSDYYATFGMDPTAQMLDSWNDHDDDDSDVDIRPF